MASFSLNVNGERRTAEAAPNTPLLWVLRDTLDLTGTKYGCGEGVCGSCTVLLDGRAVRSCTLRISDVGDKEVTTIEGLASGETPHPVQQAFLDAAAFQCGYCTPGMILASVALLRDNPKPSPREVADRLDGNICRCGSYPRIVQAVRLAAREALSE